MKKFLTLIAFFALTTFSASVLQAQIYHEECKEDLRAFMRQGTNFEKLGLTVADTLSWYDNEDWVEEVAGLVWIETDESLLRIDSVDWFSTVSKGLQGRLNLNSPVLTFLDIRNNGITELDVSQNVNLTELLTFVNPITVLDLSNNTELTHLFCANNKLVELNLSNSAKLIFLNCSHNQLYELDLSNNTELISLSCRVNYLTSLDISNNEKLESLVLDSNYFRFSTLPISNASNYIYRPQRWNIVNLGEIDYSLDMSSEYNINGHITSFSWYDITDGGYEFPEEITPPINENGVFTFTAEHLEKTLWFFMSNAQFPFLLYEFILTVRTVSVEETPEIHFTVSPNPAQTQLTIHHSKEIENIGMYDLSGRLLRTYSEAGTITVIDISDLDSGVYFLTVAGKSVKFVKE